MSMGGNTFVFAAVRNTAWYTWFFFPRLSILLVLLCVKGVSFFSDLFGEKKLNRIRVSCHMLCIISYHMVSCFMCEVRTLFSCFFFLRDTPEPARVAPLF